MVSSILSKTKTFNHLIQNCDSKDMIIDKLLDELKNVSDSTVMLINKEGEVIYERMSSGRPSLNQKKAEHTKFIESKLNVQFSRITETKKNIKLDGYGITTLEKSNAENHFGLIIPITVFQKRLATLILYKEKMEFNTDILVLSEHAATIIGIIMYNNDAEEELSKERKLSVVKSAIATLSYSELEAILYVFDELEGSEGLLVASKIADKAGITRSVIVNALRKFESAGVIESRSLGMKGTFIKVLNDYLTDELSRLRK